MISTNTTGAGRPLDFSYNATDINYHQISENSEYIKLVDQTAAEITRLFRSSSKMITWKHNTSGDLFFFFRW